MTPFRSHLILFTITISIILICIGSIFIRFGFHQELVRDKTNGVRIIMVLMFQYLVGDPIKFIIIAVDRTIWPRDHYVPDMDKSRPEYDREDFLVQKVERQRRNLLITSQYRNEKLNEMYKEISRDLWLFGRYYLWLMLAMLATWEPRVYRSSDMIKKLMLFNHTDYYGLQELVHINQLFDYIEINLINTFDTNSTTPGTTFTSPPWVHAEQWVMLGVIRVRQLRRSNRKIGWGDPEYTDSSYLPGWQKPYKVVPYEDLHWRVTRPWVPMKWMAIDSFLLNFHHIGFFDYYPELRGYSTLLSRSKVSTKMVLDFLTEQHWLTRNTSAIFIDFTMYNVDMNLFSVITLRLEQLPFGGVLPHVGVEGYVLLRDFDHLKWYDLFVYMIYILVLLQFGKATVNKVWYDSRTLKNVWNIMDLLIFGLNAVVLWVMFFRASLVRSMLKNVSVFGNMDFVDFRRGSRLEGLVHMLIGVLICLTTLRLWRILQFANVFHLFNQTLRMAWQPVVSMAMMILIFLFGFCMMMVIINGNNSIYFNRFFQSLITCMCFSFGFSSHIHPSEMFHGGKAIGLILYAILGFFICTVLINVFVAMINNYFTIAKERRDLEEVQHLDFFQFLRVEYQGLFDFYRRLPCFRRGYKRNKRTVGQNISITTDYVERKIRFQLRRKKIKIVDEAKEESDFQMRGEQLLLVGEHMETQLELLRLRLFGEKAEEATRPKQKWRLFSRA
ncbi:polycystic kidney disease 2-like 2 protein [Drosophila miranda]|uniref:polycystic kidney disease 2-like 2 protein n=1 Tax=Drosophila miranda TaxID=7229 RepID=UPI0007E77887|nr:polycystic kidney disease 2-like 2 protein [Drosophila miranda]